MLNLLPVKRSRLVPDVVSRVFDDPFFRFFEDLTTRDWLPAAEVVENENAMIFTFEVPGLEQKDINISMENGMLTISGEKVSTEHKETDYLRSERWYGKFSRSFSLPPSVDTANVSAQLRNGILTVTVPKKEEARPKKVEIRVS
jgi:HSP20 family protein